MREIRILLADDQKLIRDGLRALLQTHADIRVVGEAGTGLEAVEQTREIRPDLVLMDIRMPVMDGVKAAGAIKREMPETIIIMLTTFDDDEYIIQAMTDGASGYLLKDIGSDKLIEAIRDSLEGNIILPGRIAAKITSHLARTVPNEISLKDFTQREMDIVRLMTQGKNNREIADSLFLTVGTVKNYISQIYLKIDVNDRANAVIFFKNLGI